MSTDDDRRALDRFVAGLDVDPEELAVALTSRAVDRAMANQVLLRNLADPDPIVRARMAERIVQMSDLDPRVAAELRLLVERDEDAEVRSACKDALHAHDQLELSGGSPPRTPTRPWLHVLRLAAVRSRAPQELIELEPAREHEAPELEAEIYVDAGAVRVELSHLPGEFAGTRPILRVAAEAGAPVATLATAQAPVSAAGDVTLTGRVEGASLAAVGRWLDHGAELAVPDE
jgi:hypothetical protein